MLFLRRPLAVHWWQYKGTRSFGYFVSPVVKHFCNRYSGRKVEKLGPNMAAARWLIRCAASFRPKGRKEYVSTRRQLKLLPPTFRIESIDASDSVVHERGFEYLVGLENLKELKLNFCNWVDSYAITKVSLYCQDSLERLEVACCGSIAPDGPLALQNMRKLRVLYLCGLPLINNDERVVILAQLKASLPRGCNMDLDLAKQKFLDLVGGVKSSDLKEFFGWIKESFSFDKNDESEEGDVVMHQIVEELREAVPLNAIFPSERCEFPEYGVDSDCNPNTTLHVDSFLYDDDDIDDLVEQGKISRTYCRACGSQTTAPLTFISHSLSVSELKYVFRYLLPSLAGKTVLDVGSRLGGVLYAAYYFSEAMKIVGIELNDDLCKTQQKIIDNYCMRDRVAVVCSDMRNQHQLLSCADVLILNNVFQFFLMPQDQLLCWQMIRNTAKHGALLVTVPSLEQLTDHLKLDFSISDWIEVMPTEPAIKQYAITFGVDTESLVNIWLYRVK